MVAAPDHASLPQRIGRAIDRLRVDIRSRGLLAGIAATLGSIVLWRLHIYLLAVYRRPAGEEVDLGWGQEGERVSAMDDLEPDDRMALRNYGGDPLLAVFERRFAQGDWLAISRQEGALACCCWVHETSRFPPAGKRRVAVLQDCFTLPSFRGGSLYPRTLAFAARRLARDRPDLPIYVESSIYNRSSMRGIEKAGFVRVGLRLASPLLSRWFPVRRTDSVTGETTAREDRDDRSTTPRPEPDLDAWLDEALELTFPASDPVASPPAPLRR